MTIQTEVEIDIYDFAQEASISDLTILVGFLARKDETHRQKILTLLQKELNFSLREPIQGDNLIDHFKIVAFREAMNKYSLDEIEKRLS